MLDIKQLRLYAISLGFVPCDDRGLKYSHTREVGVEKYEVLFIIDLVQNKVFANYPDIEYNQRNPYSPRKCIKEFIINQEWDNPTFNVNIDNFIEKVCDSL